MTVEEFINQFYKPGDIVFPDAVQRKMKIPKIKAYQELESLSPAMLKPVCMIRCPNCGCYLHNIYETVKDIPEDIECFECDTEFPVDHEQNVIVVYKRK